MPDRKDKEEEDFQWGRRKGKEFQTISNFTLTLHNHIIGTYETSTGYSVTITKAGSEKTGNAWFRAIDTRDAFTWPTQLNRCFDGSLFLTDIQPKELWRLLQEMDTELQRQGPHVINQLLTTAGRQQDGIVACNPKLFLDENGLEIANDTSQWVWIPRWPGSPSTEACRFPAHPFRMDPLVEFLQKAAQTTANNFPPTLLAIASMVSMTNYSGIIDAIRHFNMPLLFGEPMTGKSLAAECAVHLLGGRAKDIYSKTTLPKLHQLFTTSTFPFVWDDPTNPADVKQVAVDLHQAAIRGKCGSITQSPKTGCLVTANFDLHEIEKYSSRLLVLTFSKLEKRKYPGEGPELLESAVEASAAMPYLLGIAAALSRDCISRKTAELQEWHPEADLRILEGISVPLVIAHKILQDTKLERYGELLEAYVLQNILASNRPTTQGSPTKQADVLVSLIVDAMQQELPQNTVRMDGSKLMLRTCILWPTGNIDQDAKKIIKVIGGKTRATFRINGNPTAGSVVPLDLLSEENIITLQTALKKQELVEGIESISVDDVAQVPQDTHPRPIPVPRQRAAQAPKPVPR